jgi:hypothetical protein
VAVRLGLLSTSEPSEAPSKDTPTKDNCVVIADFHPLFSECDPRIGGKITRPIGPRDLVVRKPWRYLPKKKS